MINVSVVEKPKILITRRSENVEHSEIATQRILQNGLSLGYRIHGFIETDVHLHTGADNKQLTFLKNSSFLIYIGEYINKQDVVQLVCILSEIIHTIFYLEFNIINL